MIKIDRVYKTYPMGKIEVKALCDISTTINSGEFLVLKGPSGSGKSTLLNLLGALDVPTHGHIYIEDMDIAIMSQKQRSNFRKNSVGFIFQNFNLIPELNVYENIEIPLLIKKEKNRKQKIIKIIEAVGLLSHINHKPYELSGGQQQRVAIARALVKEPVIVLADEPTANLDSHTGEEVLKLMTELNSQLKTTFIIASHDDLVISYAKRILELKDGKFVGEKNMAKV